MLGSNGCFSITDVYYVGLYIPRLAPSWKTPATRLLKRLLDHGEVKDFVLEERPPRGPLSGADLRLYLRWTPIAVRPGYINMGARVESRGKEH